MEEVDLIELTRKLFLKLYSNLRQLTIIFFGSVFLSGALFFVVPNRYVTNLTASCSKVKIEVVEQIVVNLRVLVKDRNYQMLADKLGITSDEAGKIKDIEFSEIRPNNVLSANSNDLFNVKITLSDKTDLVTLEHSLISYVVSNPNISEIGKLFMDSYKSNLDRVNNEINMLENVRKHFVESDYKSQSFILMNPSDFNSRLVELTQQKNDLVREIALFKTIKVMQTFNELSRPSFPRISYFLLGGIVLGLIISLLYLVFKK